MITEEGQETVNDKMTREINGFSPFVDHAAIIEAFVKEKNMEHNMEVYHHDHKLLKVVWQKGVYFELNFRVIGNTTCITIMRVERDKGVFSKPWNAFNWRYALHLMNSMTELEYFQEEHVREYTKWVTVKGFRAPKKEENSRNPTLIWKLHSDLFWAFDLLFFISCRNPTLIWKLHSDSISPIESIPGFRESQSYFNLEVAF